jgi:predicted RNase H-like nuclease (RuvC/YqgF family)
MAVLAKGKDEKILTVIEKDKTVQSLKAKKDALEAQLKEFRKKQKDQHHLEKLVQDQKYRIADLSKEIKTFKLQKL